MAAAHSTPTTFAIDRFRRRKSRTVRAASWPWSRTSRTRRRPPGGGEQAERAGRGPADRLPLTTAKTASVSDEVTMTAPAMSGLLLCQVGRSGQHEPGQHEHRASDRDVDQEDPVPVQQIRHHSAEQHPIDPPPAATKPNTPIALARSAGSGNVVTTSESATAETTAAPRPWIARAVIRARRRRGEPAPERGQREHHDPE